MPNEQSIPRPLIPESKGEKLIDVSIPDKEAPAISITYMNIDNNSFGLKGFVKKASKNHNENLYSELEKFMKLVRGYSDIQELISKHRPKNGAKSKDTESIKKLKEIKNKYNVDTSDMLHIHLKPCGKGQFVIHGFILRNRFEVVWLDPFHEKHKL